MILDLIKDLISFFIQNLYEKIQLITPSAKALFLDRDGVINVDTGYVHKKEDFYFIEGIFDLCLAAKRAGFLIIVITNQAGIGRGYYTNLDFYELTDWMNSEFEKRGIFIDDVFFCPFHPEFGLGAYKKNSYDRKPYPGMFLRAAEKFGIMLEHSIMIGDKKSDMQAAKAAGIVNRIQIVNSKNEFIDSELATTSVESLLEIDFNLFSFLGTHS